MKFKYLTLILFICAFKISAQISGTVFRDFNSNGLKENSSTYSEPFVKGVTVTAFPISGSSQTVLTDNNGAYSFTGLNLPVRIEFSDFLSGDFSSAVGVGNSSSVQFYTNSTSSANFALNYPDDYSQPNPNLTTPIYLNGASSGNNGIVLKSWAYNSTGINGILNPLANQFQIGTTYGLAYNKYTKEIYSSAYLKRHTGLLDLNNDGNGDLGSIYVTNTTNNFTTLWLDITTLGINFGTIGNDATRGLGALTAPSNDANAFSLVGKVGIGDIELSENGKILYLTNLYDKKLYAIDIDSKSIYGTWSIPSNCSNNDVVNFGLKIYRNEIYIGQVCTAESSQLATDLQATVYKFDGVNFVNILNFSLNYPKGYVYRACQFTRKFTPWISTFPSACGPVWPNILAVPQAIFSDIAFDPNNRNMILGFRDRFGDQVGIANYPLSGNTLFAGNTGGDVLIASYNESTNNYTLENNGIINGYSGGVGNNEGPGGGEFYHGDYFDDGSTPTNPLVYPSTIAHAETSDGAIVLLAGKGEMVVTSMDPLDGTNNYQSGGIRFFNQTNGDRTNGFRLYQGSDPGTYGKANGLGDLIALTDPSPIEIGNRVWLDADGDGIQDAEESPIEGVNVELLKSGSVIATASTDANGNYYFSNGAGTSSASAIYNISQLMPNMEYIVRIPNIQGGSKQTVLGTNILTTANVGGSGQPDVRDSDGSVVGNNAEVTVQTTDIPIAGANNHTFDFGFKNNCNTSPPLLNIIDNNCPNRIGLLNIVKGCGTGYIIEFSLNNGADWTTVKPFYSTSPLRINVRCVNRSDTTCKSEISTYTTNPNKCTPSGGNECNLIANATVDPCNDNKTIGVKTDDYFTIQINASISYGVSSNRYEVVIGADQTTGIGGNVLNSGGTLYGSPVTVGNTKIFKADGLTSYQLLVRDINNNNCFQTINIDPVATCSIAPPKSPCYPVPCVPIGVIKN